MTTQSNKTSSRALFPKLQYRALHFDRRCSHSASLYLINFITMQRIKTLDIFFIIIYHSVLNMTRNSLYRCIQKTISVVSQSVLKQFTGVCEGVFADLAVKCTLAAALRQSSNDHLWVQILTLY